MDYYTQASPHHLLQDTEQRRSPRKPVRQKVSIGSTGHGIIRGHTIDISVGGLSIMIPMALPLDSLCAVRFDLFVEGSLVRFAGTGQVAHCSCVGMQGFRIGMKFKLQDPNLQSHLNTFLDK